MHAQFTHLTTQDGFSLPVWCARPDTQPRGAVIVLQEIFGLTGHITDIAGRLAEAGYLALAPDLFARAGVKRPIAYSDPDAGLAAVAQSSQSHLDTDLETVLAALQGDRVGVIGFCWGGGQAWRLARDPRVRATACFYPTKMENHLTRLPAGAVSVHVAVGDRHTPDVVLAEMQTRKPDLALYQYEADHGFMCPLRPNHKADIANQAWSRVVSQFGRALSASDTGDRPAG